MYPLKLNITPDPNFERLEKVLKRQGVPDRVPFFELASNIEADVLCAIGKGNSKPEVYEQKEWALIQHINYMYYLGYDYVNVAAKEFIFPQKEGAKGLTTEGEREYITASTHTIANRNDFEKYSWPVVSNIDYSLFEIAKKLLPEGMKVITVGPGGVLENVMWLLGYEGISYLFLDDPQLVEDMFEAVATRIIKYFETVASFDIVAALVLGDDMGFKTQTMLSPAIFRKYLFPWHKKIVDTVHRHGKPIILHACGNLLEVMEDIIDCGWDARHSYEDEIMPVWEEKEKYGHRITLLGGFDMDKLSRMSEEQVRNHTRFLIEKCAPGGGWALGTGNSVANYIPVQNFLAMLDEGFRAGGY